MSHYESGDHQITRHKHGGKERKNRRKERANEARGADLNRILRARVRTRPPLRLEKTEVDKDLGAKSDKK